MKTKPFKVPINSRRELPNYTDDQLTWLAERIGLTLIQLKTLHNAAHVTYAAIGADLSDANGGKPMKRYDLVEIVQDANHMEIFALPLRTVPGTMALTPSGIINQELLAWIKTERRKYPLEHVYEAVAAGFPYPLYE